LFVDVFAQTSDNHLKTKSTKWLKPFKITSAQIVIAPTVVFIAEPIWLDILN